MRKTALIIFLCCIIPQLSFAKKHFDHKVNAIENFYKNLNTLQANFTQASYIKILDRTINKTGKIKLKKPGKLWIEYAGAKEKNYLSDGKSLWTYTREDKNSLQTYSTKQLADKTALNLLNNFQRLKKLYKVSELEQNGLLLKPRSRKTLYIEMKAYFLPNQLISKLQLYSKSGNVTEYNFTNIKTDVKIADKLFEPSFSEQVPRTLP